MEFQFHKNLYTNCTEKSTYVSPKKFGHPRMSCLRYQCNHIKQLIKLTNDYIKNLSLFWNVSGRGWDDRVKQMWFLVDISSSSKCLTKWQASFDWEKKFFLQTISFQCKIWRKTALLQKCHLLLDNLWCSLILFQRKQLFGFLNHGRAWWLHQAFGIRCREHLWVHCKDPGCP